VYEALDCKAPDACTRSIPNGVTCEIEDLDCDDRNECTIDLCDKQRGCYYTARNCSTGGTACTLSVSCDRFVGCMTTPRKCNDDDICTNNMCDPHTGCQFPPVNCTGTDPCQSYFCTSDRGCSSEPLCDPLYIGPDNCTVLQCDRAQGKCVNDSTACQESPVSPPVNTPDSPDAPSEGGPPGWVWAIVALGALFLIAAIVALIWYSKKPEHDTERI